MDIDGNERWGYVCAICGQNARFDFDAMAFFHDLGEEYRQFGTIAREVKPA